MDKYIVSTVTMDKNIHPRIYYYDGQFCHIGGIRWGLCVIL